MKHIGTLLLSFLILYAGVAWSMEACLQHGSHSEHASAADHSHSAIVRQDDSPDPSVPIIHCTPLKDQLYLSLPAGLLKLSRSQNAVPLNPILLSEFLSTIPLNDVWVEALFKRIVNFSRPHDLARHLFLSILQI
jgi:hypothetical protein